MKVTANTYVSEIITEYGDIAEIMELFGVKRVGSFGLRKVITKLITVRVAAFVHRVPLQNFLGMINSAIEEKSQA